MSSARTAAVSTANQGNDQASNDVSVTTGKQEVVIPFPSQSTPNPQPTTATVSTDYKVHPLTIEAYNLWHLAVNQFTDAEGRKKLETRRHYLPLPFMEDLAAAKEAQVTVEDINLLCGTDGDLVVCKLTGRAFTPFWWLAVQSDNQRFFKLVAAGKELTAEIVSKCCAPKVGQFFLPEGATEALPVSGVPFFWNKTKSCARALWSPLYDAYAIAGNNWGHTRSAAEGIIQERKEKAEAERLEHEKLEQGLSSFEEAFRGAGHRNQTGRDRRPTFRPGNQR